MSALLLHWGSYRWARNLWVLIIYLFFLLVMLPSGSKARHRFVSESVSWCLETSADAEIAFDDLQMPLMREKKMVQ